jgi:hypothetical protein
MNKKMKIVRKKHHKREKTIKARISEQKKKSAQKHAAQ